MGRVFWGLRACFNYNQQSSLIPKSWICVYLWRFPQLNHPPFPQKFFNPNFFSTNKIWFQFETLLRNIFPSYQHFPKIGFVFNHHLMEVFLNFSSLGINHLKLSQKHLSSWKGNMQENNTKALISYHYEFPKSSFWKSNSFFKGWKYLWVQFLRLPRYKTNQKNL